MPIDRIGMPHISVYSRGYTLIRNTRVVFCSKWVRHWNGSWQDPLRSISGCSFYFQQQASSSPPSQQAPRLLVAQGDCAAIGYIAGIFHIAALQMSYFMPMATVCHVCPVLLSLAVAVGGVVAAARQQSWLKLARAGLAGCLVGYVGDWKREGEHFPLLANAPKRPNNFRARRNLCSNSGESRCFYGNSW